jgi:hypothetical protein
MLGATAKDWQSVSVSTQRLEIIIKDSYRTDAQSSAFARIGR